jgi:hypothetical protein
MPLLTRHRTALTLVAAVAGGALLGPGAAFAGSPTVTFSGSCGLLGIGASSQPDTGSVTISSGSSVTFVNHLDQPAQLMINNSAATTLAKDTAVPVSFTGPATVALVPGCLLGHGTPGTVAVGVGQGSSTPTAGAPTKAGAPTTPGARTSATPSGSRSPGESLSASPSDSSPAPSGLADPTQAGLAGDFPSALPSDAVAAVGAATPAPGRHGPSGLLTLISTVCVVGVSIAAIRVIIAQRALRTVTA